MDWLTSMLSLVSNAKEKYIGSNRARTTIERPMHKTRKDLFLSPWNIAKVTRIMAHRYKDTIGGPFDHKYFIDNVPKWMANWPLVDKLNQFEDHRYNFADTFLIINRTFIRSYLEKLRYGINTAATHDIRNTYGSGNFNELTDEDYDDYHSLIPYYQAGLYETPSWSETALAHDMHRPRNNGNLGEVLIDEIKHEAATSIPRRDYYDTEDYRQIDAWSDNEVYTDNKRYRYENKIPGYRTHIHMHHHDRSNEGLRGHTELINDRFRKYDLSNIGDDSDVFD